MNDVPVLTLEQLNRDACVRVLQSPDTYATTLITIAHAVCGEELYDLDPIEIFMAIEDAFAVKVTEPHENKINAWLLSVTTPAFFEDVRGFTSVCQSFATGYPDDAAIAAMTPGLSDLSYIDMKWAVYEVGLAYDELPGFSKSVRQLYLREVNEEVVEDGFLEAITGVDDDMEDFRLELQTELHLIGASHVQLP